MREGGRLDGFPVHLLRAGEGEGATLILDSDDLGRLQTAPVPGCAGIGAIALARDRKVLQRTRDEWDPARGPTPLLVCASPEAAPFPHRALSGIITSGDVPGGLRASLREDGGVLRIDSPKDWGRADSETGPDGDHRDYYIRPACGCEYFTTGSWRFSDWPFDGLQLGRLRELELAAARRLEGLGLTRLYDGTRLRVETARAAPGRIELCSGEAARGFGLFVKVAWNALLIGADAGRRIVKFPLIDVASQRMAEQAEHLEGLFEADQPLASFVPRVIERGVVQGQAYWVETLCPGVPATKVPLWPRRGGWGARWKQKAAREGVEYLTALHSETAEMTIVSRDIFEQFSKPRIESISRDARRLEPSFDLSPLSEALYAALAQREIPLVRTHGDYWPGNVLVTRNADLTAVLDWDASEERGWPLLDLLHFIAFQHKRRAFWKFGTTVVRRLAARRLPAWELGLADRYCRDLGVAPDLWTPFVALYWLERVSQWLVTDFHEGKRNDRWLRRNVLCAVPALTAALRAASADLRT